MVIKFSPIYTIVKIKYLGVFLLKLEYAPIGTKNPASITRSDRFAWFWFNYDEIFSLSVEDFESRAKELKKRGITIAILFTCTHFRLSFHPYWDEITSCIARIVKAFHKYNIRVVEHHSASLIYDLKNSLSWDRLKHDLGSYSDWNTGIENWDRLIPFHMNNPEIDGVPLDSIIQIDGRTGLPVVSQYNTRVVCYNNPDYRRIYFDYLKSVCDTGIDGIMNDDIQYFGDKNACTCIHCRKLFKEQTGYELPEPESWNKFFNDYKNPAYLAWERFKRDSTKAMKYALADLYSSLGLSLIRPQYSSNTISFSITASDGFDDTCELWDIIFHENCFSSIIKASYLCYMTEAVHRYAKAERHGIPAMSLFYPDSPDSVYFSWALSQCWGEMYSGTFHGKDITELEAPFRSFENIHKQLFCNPKKYSDVAFYFSRKTRDYTDNSENLYMLPFTGCIQAAYVSGLTPDMVFEEDDDNELFKHDCIVASHIAMVTDDELARFVEYVNRGGKLIILGEFARFKPDGTERGIQELADKLNVKSQVFREDYTGEATINYNNEKINIETASGSLVFSLSDDENSLCAGANEKVLGIEKQSGNGRLFWIPSEINDNELQPIVWSDRRLEIPPAVKAANYVIEKLRDTTGKLLKSLIKEPVLKIHCANRDVLGSCFKVDKRIVIHIINTADTIPKRPCKIEHSDIISNFTPTAKKLPEITVECKKARQVNSVTLFTPESKKAYQLEYNDSGNKLIINIPSGIFSGYAVIEVI